MQRMLHAFAGAVGTRVAYRSSAMRRTPDRVHQRWIWASVLIACGGGAPDTTATARLTEAPSDEREPTVGIRGSNVRDIPGLACEAAPAPIDATALVDDMEDGDGTLAPIAGRNGTWWVDGDGTPGAEIAPQIDADVPIAAEPIDSSRCGSQFAMHVRGRGFDDWGAHLAFSLRYDATGLAPVDLRNYAGVSFWARVGGDHDATLRVGFQDANSAPPGGRCDPEGSAGAACYDTFGTEVQPLSPEWQQYRLYFTRLEQRGVGLHADALDVEHLYGMEFSLSPERNFDLWVDDLFLIEAEE
jgi:hypothetical protein